jgi:CspA family cold shock protein
MTTGTVKWFNPQKGFGFIQPVDGSKDIFVHISAVEQAGLVTLNDGQQVSFDVEEGRQGRMAAINLKVRWTTEMEDKDPHKLRARAVNYRRMLFSVSDAKTRFAISELAEECDAEADRIEALRRSGLERL